MVNDHTAFRVDWMPFGGTRKLDLEWVEYLFNGRDENEK